MYAFGICDCSEAYPIGTTDDLTHRMNVSKDPHRDVGTGTSADDVTLIESSDIQREQPGRYRVYDLSMMTRLFYQSEM